jgi:hypothetical protein
MGRNRVVGFWLKMMVVKRPAGRHFSATVIVLFTRVHFGV